MQKLRRRVWVGLAGVLAITLSGVVLRSRLRSGREARRSDAAPLASVAGSRRYAKPLVSLKDVGVGDDEFVDDAPDSADQPIDDFKPRSDLPAWDLKLPLDWSADPFDDVNWRAQLHMLRMIDGALARHEKTHDPGSYREALAVVLDWWRYHQEAKAVPSLVWNAMTAGVRAARLAYVLDRAFSGKAKLAPSEEAALLAMAEAHVVRLRDPESLARSNHGLFQMRGLMLLCRVLGNSGACKGGDAYVEMAVRELLDQQFTADGVHREHSPGYHVLAIDAFEAFAQPAGSGVFRELAERLEQARAATPWFVFPDGRLALLGDTEGDAPTTPPPHQRCAAGAPPTCAEVAQLSRSGYAIVRSPWSEDAQRAFMLIMTSSYNSGAHKHADDLSFELMDGGQMLFVDAGKYSYQGDSMRRFVRSVRAHNTVGLETAEIDPIHGTKHASGLEPTEEADGVYTLRGQVEHPTMFSQTRRVDYAPGRFLRISDELRGDSQQTYQSYLHLPPKLKPTAEGTGFMVPLKDGRTVRIESLSHDCVASKARGRRNRRQTQGWVTQGYRHMIPASALTFTCAGRNRNITLLVSFDDAGRKAGILAGSRGR